ncbi:Acetyltransferase (GNAT) family protein [Desulfatibacillum alkenivorans DSM 16219]|jgi:GNAT superfamily N-acetyltransferase|uniref:Acetyltransferase (GNAT) family protein n=1 Tax=Desulfatibacillum alkenivorans DSM 16219 TaxID=1121393 RepID=A0A1M6VSX9_9BACT|nr:GNAT family N-acetyltransferase [Desulfatibacillum alkenivorans]SHK84580.1 Acetyltransferase (GNAT) family protein [Desulfatibacillum alkenivorans DSM 16219]
MEHVVIATYVAGAIGRVAEMHARYYSENWGFGLYFEAKVASELSEFMNRFVPGRDYFKVALTHGRVHGSLAIDAIKAEEEGAHLRWFITSSALRGTGAGNRLLQDSIDFCRRQGYPSIYLWTFEGLALARHLYEKFGFKLVEEHPGDQWGVRVKEQKFVLPL